MRRGLLILLVLAAAAAALVVASLPPEAQRLPTEGGLAPAVRGAIHVHSDRSDGSGSPEEIAAAAARAGLRFVILTDHGDAASAPAAPFYSADVLVIDGVEISTEGGHVLALGLPRSPYPLGGEARDVIADIERLGGFSIVAHPDSPKPDLGWLEWAAPFGGLEWINGDSEWRDEPALSLATALFTYPFRSPETVAALLDRPDTTLRRWDVLTARRRVVAVAGADAHARIPGEGSPALPIPAYETVFRALSSALAPATFTGDAAADARTVLEAIRRGHVYSAIGGLATPAALSFAAVADGRTFTAGDAVPPGARAIELRIDSNAPADARVVLLENGEPRTTAGGGSLRQQVSGGRAVYRVEVYLPRAPGEPPVPWIVSNPIYVGFGAEGAPPERRRATGFAQRFADGSADDWTTETSARSKAAFEVIPAEGGERQILWRWGLGGTVSESPYAALVMPAGGRLQDHDRLVFTGRASRPMRLSVQIRAPGGQEGERWHRSVYLDDTPREITIFFDDMTPRGFTSTRRPDLATVHDVLFVVDSVNMRPGESGQVWIDDIRYGS